MYFVHLGSRQHSGCSGFARRNAPHTPQPVAICQTLPAAASFTLSKAAASPRPHAAPPQDLESSVLRLPVHLGNEPRCKAALDELQALLGNVAQYRAEAEDTRCHLEAAVSAERDSLHPCTQHMPCTVCEPASEAT